MFYVIEGLDGAGTTTQTEAVTKTLREVLKSLNKNSEGLSIPVTSLLSTKEPNYHSPIGKMLKDILTGKTETNPYTLALLFAADRFEHNELTLQPNDTDSIIICDRYVLSSLAYQTSHIVRSQPEDFSGHLQHEVMDWVNGLSWNKILLEPDHMFFLDVSVEECCRRVNIRDGGKNELFDKELEFINDCYTDALRRYYPKSDWTPLDGEQEKGVITGKIIEKILLDFTEKYSLTPKELSDE